MLNKVAKYTHLIFKLQAFAKYFLLFLKKIIIEVVYFSSTLV